MENRPEIYSFEDVMIMLFGDLIEGLATDDDDDDDEVPEESNENDN